MEKLQEQENRLFKANGDHHFAIEKGFNLGITMTKPTFILTQQFDEEEINMIACWLNKNYNLSLCPSFKEVQELEQTKVQLKQHKQIIENDIERMAELGGLIKSLANALAFSIDGSLSEDGKRQAMIFIEKAKHIYD